MGTHTYVAYGVTEALNGPVPSKMNKDQADETFGDYSTVYRSYADALALQKLWKDRDGIDSTVVTILDGWEE